WAARGPGADVRGARAAGHHARRQPDGRGADAVLLVGTREEGGAMSIAAPPAAADARLERRIFEPRALKSLVLTVGVSTAAILAGIPLVSVLYMLIVRGGARLSTSVFTELPPAGFEMGGGFGNAIAGTVVMIAIAAALSIPFGILA